MIKETNRLGPNRIMGKLMGEVNRQNSDTESTEIQRQRPRPGLSVRGSQTVTDCSESCSSKVFDAG
ncbi:MAG TPA: hypothetical protein VIF83_12240 [Gemmatimonadaceae bacterium]|jgi:hypothetical protein